MNIQHLIALLIVCLFVNTGKSVNSWNCSDKNLCELSSGTDGKLYDSQNICRLSCGKYGSIWPQPTKDVVLSNDRVYFDPWKIRFNLVSPNPSTSQFLTDVNRIFLANILKECLWNCTLNNSREVFVKVSVTAKSLELDWNTDETYSLVLHSSDGAVYVDIRAITVYGARHGIETLSNLITGSTGNGLVMVAAARINDNPMFKHRGVLLDTARNYIPVKNIKRTLDAMAASKFNVLHWHATDSQSFPLEITRIPEMQRFGAYSAHEIYSRADIQNIIKYAKIRGIRVLIELDAPSHSGNGWQWAPMAGLGNLSVCLNEQPWRKFCIQPPCGQLNPANENVYGVLKDIFADLAEVISKEETIHMGGDEVFIPCWNSTEEIIDYMASKGDDRSMESFLKLWSEFHNENLRSWDEVNTRLAVSNPIEKPVILWSSHLTDPEVIEKYLPKERYIIQTWVESSLPLNEELLNKGYKIIVSTKNAWYLDHGFWGRTQYYNWKTVYDNLLTKNNGVLGGEVCLWSEFIDENSLDTRLWPRAGAAAERLWSNPNTSSNLAEQRFNRYRDRLISRGVRPDAVSPKWCKLNEGQCL